ncbi:MAG: chromate resistance protein [Chloroflexi bacterium]|nr:chromate resistance protein [Chloroflexota bacterium]
MKWVTWENVGVDRMACVWLIRKQLDPQAEFVFVAVGTKPLPEGAEPFDIPGVRYSHHRGHCTFFTFLKEHKIKDPVLQRIAQIVDEADVVQETQVEAAAPGLDLICRGIRNISKNDEEALERGALIYDALYAGLAAEAE